MVDVTEIILNFQKVLISIFKAFSYVGIERGMDEWDDVTEDIFDILVIQYLHTKYKCLITHEYETWQNNNRLIFKISPNSKISIGTAYYLDGLKGYKHEYHDLLDETIVSFIEFGNRMYDENDVLSLNYVTGMTEKGDIMCAKQEDCRFFIKA